MKTLKLGISALALLTALNLEIATHEIRKIQSAKESEIACLAKNIYMEARGESIQGQIAVAQVTLNRVHSGKFQKTVCGVVYAPKQFSWTNKKTSQIKDSKAWALSKDIARAVLTNSVPLPAFKALYFHTRQVNPRWNRDKQVVAKIGNHIFYS